MRHIFIINPVAGNGKYQIELTELINTKLKNTEIEYEIYFSKFKGDIQSYLKDKCRDLIPSVIYACGGDGTLHEVINAACMYKHVSIGVIPCGSGNDFIKNFINYDLFNNIEFQINGESVYIDLVKIKDKYAASVCNIGLDADAAFNMHKFKKLPFISGSTRYYLAVLYCLVNKLGKSLEITIDENEKLSDSFLLGVIANGQFYGGGYRCAPLATVNDGLIDLCFVENISRFKIMSLIGSYKLGEHLKNPKINKYITYKKTKQVKIKSHEPLNVCIDGESYVYSEVELKIEKNAMNFWIPKGTQLQNIGINEASTLIN